MKNTKKKIYIINGVMGIIGSPIFTYLAQQKDTIIYGISRQGLPMDNFIKGDKLPKSHLVFSLGDYLQDGSINIHKLVNALPEDYEIVFVHAMGVYLTELNNEGELLIKNDEDNDGINDLVKKITYDVPLQFAKEFAQGGRKTIFTQIGSLSDEWNLKAHYSWVTSMNMLKGKLAKISNKYENFNTCIINVSSVVTPKELIERPFVTTQTNADLGYWLNPLDIGKEVHNLTDRLFADYSEVQLFNPWPEFKVGHFTESVYNKRRILELFPKE
jgi:hypothetical protein